MIINGEYMVNYQFKVKNHKGFIHVSTMLKSIIMRYLKIAIADNKKNRQNRMEKYSTYQYGCRKINSVLFHLVYWLTLTYLYARPLKNVNLVNNSEGGEGLEDETGRICRKLVSGQSGCL